MKRHLFGFGKLLFYWACTSAGIALANYFIGLLLTADWRPITNIDVFKFPNAFAYFFPAVVGGILMAIFDTTPKAEEQECKCDMCDYHN